MNFDDEKRGVFSLRDKGERMKDKERLVIGIILFVLLVMLIACGGGKNVNVANSSVSQVPMRMVTDDLGRTVTVPVKITRVVSLAPNVTENIFAVGAGDCLVGVTTFCNYPEAAKSIAKIGDTMNPNMESIVALKPDVVFVSTASQIEAFTKTLEANGIVVFVTNPNSLEGVFKNLRQLADVLGTTEVAEVFIVQLEERVGIVSHGVSYNRLNHPAEQVFVQISKEPLFTIGKESFFTQIIELAGGVSVTRNVETAYPKLSKETAAVLKPEAIILSESEDNQEPNEVFRNTPAVKNGRIYKVNADILSRPGPRLVDALEQIARHLHPDKFRNN